MADEHESALARWSRLKRARVETKTGTVGDDIASEPAADSRQRTEIVPPKTGPQAEPDDAPAERDDLDLPDIADLNADSDFSAFLREGVSEEIRRKALRVLWRSDPVLANLDGLNDYDEDFRSASAMAEAVRTAYKAGKGFVGGEEERPVLEERMDPEPGRAAEEKQAEPEQPAAAVTADAEPAASSDRSGHRPGTGDDPKKNCKNP